MTPTNDVFLLIKSLSSQEKRLFTQFASRHVIGAKNKYLILFEYIDAQESYDETACKQHFDQVFSDGHFATEKSRLYDLILSSLRGHMLKSKPGFRIRGWLDDVRILRKKALNTQSNKRLQKAKREAVKYELLLQMLEILDLERVGLQSTPANGLQTDFTTLQQEIDAVLSQLTTLYQYRAIFDKVYRIVRASYYNTEEKDIAEIETLLNQDLMQSPPQEPSFHAHKLYSQIYSHYYSLKNDYVQATHFYRREVDLWQEYPAQVELAARDYIVTLGNYAGLCLHSKEFEGFNLALDRLGKIKIHDRGEQCEQFQNLVHLKLLYTLNVAELASGREFLRTINQDIDKFHDILNPARLLTICHNCAMLHFVSGEFSQALQWINRIKLERKGRVRTDLVELDHLLELVIHYELANMDTVEYLYRNNKRYLKQVERFGEFEQLVFKSLKSLSHSIDPQKRRSLFKNIQEAVALVRNAAKGRSALGLLEIGFWVQSKLNTRAISAVFDEWRRRNANSDPD